MNDYPQILLIKWIWARSKDIVLRGIIQRSYFSLVNCCPYAPCIACVPTFIPNSWPSHVRNYSSTMEHMCYLLYHIISLYYVHCHYQNASMIMMNIVTIIVIIVEVRLVNNDNDDNNDNNRYIDR